MLRTKAFIVNSFSELNLSAPLLKALASEGYETPTPIQAKAIPDLLAGRDLLGIAQTGTGKTAAFALPILEHLAKKTERPARKTCRALILSPTRELAAQIADSFKTYGRNVRVSTAVVFGGVSISKQISILQGGVDVLVATPGRLVDLIDRRAVTLDKLEVFVLDEVDQMLDLGFIHAIRKITGLLPKQRQNLFFSATMPKEIAGLADALLKDPVRVEVAPVATTAERVKQSVIHVDQSQKPKLLAELLGDTNMTRTLVFTRTKHGADRVVKGLNAAGITASAIHGNKSQSQRERALAGFKAGKILVLVATDIAARGIDIDGVSHVVNYDLPHVPESYVHRIGRTARAGAEGTAIAFCATDERPLLRDIERTIRQQVPVIVHPLGLSHIPQPQAAQGRRPSQQKPRQHQGQHQAKKPGHFGRNEHAGKPSGEQRNRPNGEQRARPRGEQRPDAGGEQRARPNGEQRARPQDGKPAQRHADARPSGGKGGGNAPLKRGDGKPSWMKRLGNKDTRGKPNAVRFGA
jgi:ATP-dependent RNA helicase RhlE